MAIQQTTKKIHFIPYTSVKGREKDENPAPTVTVNTKFKMISFSRQAMTEMQMDGKFVRLFFEPIKKVIGWQIRDSVKDGELKTWKLVKAKLNGNYSMSITKLLNQFDGRLKKESYKNIPVQKYREMNSLSEFKGQVFFFVELIEDPDELRKGIGNPALQDASSE